jgi:hypothetical protein
MKKEDILFLRQLVNSLEGSMPKLKKAYEKKDAEDFNETKSFMLKVQGQIDNILK